MFGVFQSRVPASTPYERDPKALDVVFNSAALVCGADAPTSANFWSAIAKMGAYITTSPNGAKQTILNVASGRGRFYGAICPANLAGITNTLTITVDGVPYTVGPISHPSVNGRRMVLNCFVQQAVYTTASNAGGTSGNGALEARAAAAIAVNMTDSLQIATPAECKRFIKFDTSLKVEIQTNGADDGTANAAYSGVIYSMDG